MQQENLEIGKEAGARDSRFPDDFLFGVATAAHQVEGGLHNNDWHLFTASPAIRSRLKQLSSIVGQLVHLKSAGEALRYEELETLEADLDRAQALGLNSYRFSLEWSRLEPRPPGRWGRLDRDALAYYRCVIRACRERGLEPVVTLNHFSLPLWVLTPPEGSALSRTIGLPRTAPDAGFMASLQGWENPATVDAFVAYTRRVVRHLQDEVNWWITLNEPVGSMIGLGYVAGAWPPGFNLDGPRARQAYLNLIRAHVRAFDAIKEIIPDAQVGVAHAMMHTKRASKAPPALFTTHEASREQFDYFYNWHFLEAIILGRLDVNLQHQEAGRRYLQGLELNEFLGLPPEAQRDIWPRLDFIGLNYYRSVYVYRHPVASPLVDFTGGFIHNDLREHPEPHQLTNDLGWEIYPQGLGDLLIKLHRRYRLPVMITENGLAESEDRNRAAHLVAHLEQIVRALEAGVDVRGYLYWTLADNFEWHEAYSRESRFGLFRVDRGEELSRRITTGAVALSQAAAARSLALLLRRYGAVLPDASRLQPPARSPGGTWEGCMEDGTPMLLHLDRMEGGDWWGLIFYPETQRWRRLEGFRWQPEERRLAFEQPAGKAPARKFEATVDGIELRGSSEEGGRQFTWRAGRMPLAGNWQSADWPFWLTFYRLEGNEPGWAGRYLTGEHLSGWQTLDGVEAAGDGVCFRIGNTTFSLRLAGEALEGESTLPDSRRPWKARRLPDELPF